MKFRKRPGEIEAEQYEQPGVLVRGMCREVVCPYTGPHVHTIHGGQSVLVQLGDWIIPEPDKIHFYPIKPDIFEATYERVDDEIRDSKEG